MQTTAASQPATSILNDGALYVAQFPPDGSGQWLELKFGLNGITPANAAYAFADQADVLVNTPSGGGCLWRDEDGPPGVGRRQPEELGSLFHPHQHQREQPPPPPPLNKAGMRANPRFYNDKRTNGTDQKGNPNGHVIRFAEDAGYADALSFTWRRVSVRGTGRC